MPYDLFICYSRKDNLTNQVPELKKQNEPEYLEFAKEERICIFDKDEIRGKEDFITGLITS